MRKRITICPKVDQNMYVSASTRPVTQDAEVAVKNAVSKFTHSPLRLEIGSISKIVPAMIVERIYKTIKRGYDSGLLILLFIIDRIFSLLEIFI
jgi:hypothetical protein